MSQEEEIDSDETDVQVSVPQTDAASLAREALHNQFVAAVICGDTGAVENLFTQHELDVNVMCVVRKILRSIYDQQHFLMDIVVASTRAGLNR